MVPTIRELCVVYDGCCARRVQRSSRSHFCAADSVCGLLLAFHFCCIKYSYPCGRIMGNSYEMCLYHTGSLHHVILA